MENVFDIDNFNIIEDEEKLLLLSCSKYGGQ